VWAAVLTGLLGLTAAIILWKVLYTPKSAETTESPARDDAVRWSSVLDLEAREYQD
jgi:hypothetical protein